MISEHCKLMTNKLQITAPTHYRIKLIHSFSLFYNFYNLLLHSSNKRRHSQTTPAHWTIWERSYTANKRGASGFTQRRQANHSEYSS